jgi:hypothetical protein
MEIPKLQLLNKTPPQNLSSHPNTALSNFKASIKQQLRLCILLYDLSRVNQV